MDNGSITPLAPPPLPTLPGQAGGHPSLAPVRDQAHSRTP
jgi:hypothetical protein